MCVEETTKVSMECSKEVLARLEFWGEESNDGWLAVHGDVDVCKARQ